MRTSYLLNGIVESFLIFVIVLDRPMLGSHS